MAIIHNLVVVSVDETQANIERDLIAEAGLQELAGMKLKNVIKAVTSGVRPGTIQTKANAVKATGTVTLVSHLATHTVTVNGVTFTCVASGATGNQYNVGASDSLTAVNMAAAINASTDTDGLVLATAGVASVTLTALVPTELGNAVTLAISAGGSVSGARMSGGTNGSSERSHNYGSVS